MAMDYTSSWLATVIAAVSVPLAALFIRYLASTRRPQDFPPGPPIFLGIGNLHQIPLQHPFLQFHEWSKTYGDILGLKVGPENLVILHSAQYVHELLDKRGAIYSGRPYSYIPSEHVFREHSDKHILNLQNGPYLRRWRSAVSYLVGPAGDKQTIPMQEITAANLNRELLASPSDFLRLVKRWALATPLLAITGERLEDRGEGFANRFFKAQHEWLELLEPGNAPPVDLIPALKWVPERFADWKTKARYVREYMVDEYAHFFHTASSLRLQADGQHGGASGRMSPSLMTKIMEDREQETDDGKRFSDDEIAFLGGGLLDAAVDTTWATAMSFIMFLGAYPDVQTKAQEEIDRVSPNSPPGGGDLNDLPYLRACLMEVFRLRPPAPSGLPHVLDCDDIFQGYKIPKGTTILISVWGIQRNPDDYEEPEKFMPERYLNNPMGLKPGADAKDGRRGTYTFGSGRRICPGEQFAYNSVLIMVSKLLWAFKIVPPEPLDMNVKNGFNTGLALGPKPFSADFILRDGIRSAGIVADFETRTSAMK